MESNHRFLGVGQESLPLDHGTAVCCAVRKLRELESNQRPPGSAPGVTTSSNYPGILFSSGRWTRTTTAWFKARRPAVSRSPNIVKVPCESRTRVPSLEGWRPCRSAKSTCERKERESNPQGSSLDCFRDSCRRPSACPSVPAISCGGRNRTCVWALNRRLPVPAPAPPQTSQDGGI